MVKATNLKLETRILQLLAQALHFCSSSDFSRFSSALRRLLPSFFSFATCMSQQL